MLADLLAPAAPLSRATLIGGTICALWASALTVWVVRALVRRRRQRAQFDREAAERGFTPEEADGLWDLGSRRSDRNRVRILESVQAFDACADAARVDAAGSPMALPEYLTEFWVSGVRRKYLPVRRAIHNITNTQQLEINQPVRVRLPDGAVFNTFVTGAGSDSLSLSLLGGSKSMRFSRNQTLEVAFSRPMDARYEFRTEVLEKSPDGSAVRAAHTTVRRFQQREHVRVRCRDNVRLVFVPPEQVRDLESVPTRPELPFAGSLKDLSVGGACFVTDAAVPAGMNVLLRMTLKRAPWTVLVPGRVLRAQKLVGTSGAMTQVSIKFEPLGTREEYQLSQHVAAIQQMVIRRMIVRAGGEEESVPPEVGAAPLERPLVGRPVVLPAPMEPTPQVEHAQHLLVAMKD